MHRRVEILHAKARPRVCMEMDEHVGQGRLAYWDPDFKTRLGTQD